MCSEANPQAPRFAHLHQHTQYSLLDGAAKLKDLLKWVKQVSPHNPACAMTDHGNMHGAVHFYNYAQSMQVKPVLGYEAYVVPGFGTRRDKKSRQAGEKDIFHLTLLARDFEGYQNLCRLSSRGYTEGYYYKPRIDHELLQEHHKGIIAFSGCLGSEVQQLILTGNLEKAKERLLWYQSIFKDNYFIEIQNHGLKEQQQVNPVLKQWAQELGIGMVATNDGHYVKKDDAKAHDALLAIQTKAVLADENRFKFPCEEFYIKDIAEMQQFLPPSQWGDEMYSNTAMIADMCNVDLPVGKKRVYQMPALPIPEGRSMAEELRVQTYSGSVARYGEYLTPEIMQHYTARAWEAALNVSGLHSYYQKRLGDNEEKQQHLNAEITAQQQHLTARLPEFDPLNTPPEKLYTALAFMGSMWEHLGKYAGEKYTLYPALDILEQPENTPNVASKDAQYAITLLRRAEYELSVINNMGFPDYFLIVADYINWAKKQGISVGPGRGSGAGSLVAYATGITNLDPLEFGLLFERFLNPDRISMPDFDIDFSDSRREEVIHYVRRKYGDEKVAQIATFGTMASKACLKDVARVMEVDFKLTDTVSKLIPVKFGKSYSLEEARHAVPEIAQALESSPPLKNAYEFAQKLEGLTRHASVHAAGVVIGRSELTDLVPLMRDTSGEGIVCQYDMKACEDIGLIKMDFLGLRTLSFLEQAQRILKESKHISVDFDRIPFDDPKTFELMGRGECKGIFQFEGGGIADATRRMKPKRLADLVAMSALYRPGPMENIPTYIRRHHGQEPVTYHDFPVSEAKLEPILRETYGIPVYQEQIMQIASHVAGYSLGQADLLRRAMGKKDQEEMKRQRQLFVEGSVNASQVPENEGNALFDLLDKFANYGFNKCLVEETEVYAVSGERYTLQELYATQHKPVLASVNAQYRLIPQSTENIFDNGVKAVFELRTSLGKSITATGNHPFLTLDGWKNLTDLQQGERIASPALLPICGQNHWDIHQLVILGWVLSEGNTCHPAGAYVYTQNPEQLDDITQHAQQFDNTKPTVKQRPERQNVYDVYLGTGQRGIAGRSGLRLWLESLGMVGLNALQKHIPAAVFALHNDDIAVILGRMWSGDGFIFGKNNTTPYFATSSERLAKDVQHLLLRLGVVSTFSQKTFKYLPEDKTGYTLHLVGRRSIENFLEQVAVHVVGKHTQIDKLKAYLSRVSHNSESKDTIPASVKHHVQALRQTKGITWKELEQHTGVCSKEFCGDVKPYKKGFRRSTVLELAEFFESQTLQDICSEELFWESVESITPKGEAQTYDLEIAHTHNFVANDVVVHNSHSAAYGVISYQTAWLKANHPVEFMAALLTVERGNSDKVAEYISDAGKMGVVVLPPSINFSSADFKVVGEKIYFGLYAIKNMGEAVAEHILAERERAGAYASFAEFCKRNNDGKLLNRRTLESLIKSGAMDDFGERKSLLESIEEMVRYAQVSGQDSGMDSLFGAATVSPEPRPKDTPPFGELERLKAEKEALGLYISGHPLAQYEGLQEASTCKIADLDDWFAANHKGSGRLKVVLSGMIEAIAKKPTKSGGMMAKFNLADDSGVVELVAFGKAYDRVQEKLLPDTPALVIVELENNEGGMRAIVDEVVLVEQLHDIPKVVWTEIDLDQSPKEDLLDYCSLLPEYTGTMPLRFKVVGNGAYAILDTAIQVNHQAISMMQQYSWMKPCIAYDSNMIVSRFSSMKPKAWQDRKNTTH